MIKRYEATELSSKDVEELIELWHICFGDEKQYIENFFYAFKDNMSVYVYCEDGKKISALYCLCAHIVYSGKCEKAKYVYAVSTLPEYRKRGFASRLIEEIKREIESNDVIALFLTPSSEKNRMFYKKLGFDDGLYSCEFEFSNTNDTGKLVLQQGKDEDLFSLRENCLKDVAHIMWDRDHLNFGLKNNIVIVLSDGCVAGYFHYEKTDEGFFLDEVCIPKEYMKDTLVSACNFLDVKKLKVCAYYAENCCKYHKSMIYCKFESVQKEITKNPLYLGVNFE